MNGSWHITRRFIEPVDASAWRGDLAQRLGEKPRRLGEWVELGLYGALRCLNSTTLDSSISVAVLTHGSTMEATVWRWLKCGPTMG